jgi:hypothetical protein
MTLPCRSARAQTDTRGRRADHGRHGPTVTFPPVQARANDHPRFAWRPELGRLAALVGASALAIAQPVLDAFGKSPETFVFRDARGADLVLFALVVVAVPPLLLWGAGLAVGALAPRWRTLVHGASMGLLLGLAAMQILSSAARPVALALALAVAIGGWVLTVRARGFQMWSQLLAGLAVMALVAFLVLSPSSDLVTNREFDAVAAQRGAGSVVLVVLDELPTASIIDASGAIDEARFPNLARLASDGTWYRNHTTQAGFTTEAVPTIFTGRAPEGGPPLFTEHPDNLFRLLAASHDLVVSEALTQLCPVSVCGDHPTPPGEEVAAGGADAQMGALLRDAVDLWWERVAHAGDDSSGDLGAFAEELVVDSGPSFDVFGGNGAPPALGSVEGGVAGEPERVSDFLDALRPRDRPMAAVIHVVSPHFPWRHLPDGTLYAAPAEAADLPINGGKGGVPWIQDLERQRHLLQAGYADALVGRILDEVDAVGLYDEATIVVTADHGVAFRADEDRRRPVDEALPEILWSPLIVKAPGQTEPRVDDSNMQTIDILPTIADLIGVDIPWEVDGLAAGSEAQRDRGDTKLLRRFPTRADPDPEPSTEVDGSDGFEEMLELAYPPLDPSDPLRALYSLSGYGELVGQPFEPTGEIDVDSFEVDDLERLLRTFELPFVLTGTVAGGEVGEDAVAAVADGRIVAVSPVVPRNVGGPAFALLLPLDGSAGLRELRLALVRGDDLLDGGEIVD